MSLLIKNARVVDPANKHDARADILVSAGKIAKVAKTIKSGAKEVIEAKDKIVMPGLVDMHVHLREPGREDKETVASATAAALKGGITSLLAMPNTYPPIDSTQSIALLDAIIKKDAKVNVLISACITKARRGEQPVDLARLKAKGIVAITDDGSSVEQEALMLEALKDAKRAGVLVICHSEDKALSKEGVVNLGLISTRLGLRGISCESEYKRVERDIRLAAKAKAPIHITHVSCKESVKIIARAKQQGLRVTCDTAPHYFALSDEAVLGFDTNMKVNPPLRSREDVAAIRQALKDGTIDAIASDHAPHTENEKDISFDLAEFGSIGLETELAVGITELVGNGVLDYSGLVQKMAVNPARILGIQKGTLGEGGDADIIIFSAESEWTVKEKDLLSKSKNSAFLGRRLKGVVEYTIRGGNIAYQAK